MSQGDHQMPFRVLIVGGGRIGSALALFLSRAPEFSVMLVDPTEPARERAHKLGLALVDADPSDRTKLDRLLRETDVVIAAMPALACAPVAAAAKRLSVHYIDLNEDSSTAAHIASIAREAAKSFIPQCGISPGLISPLTLDLAARTPSAQDIQIRIGSLPRYSTNRLGYGLAWDVNALIAEYTSPSAALRKGKSVKLQPLSEKETLYIDGRTYEAFVSGSVPESLCQRLGSRVDTVISKTIRYPGHLDYIDFLFEDLRLRERPDLLRNLLLNALPEIDDDQLLILISARGTRDRHEAETIWWRRILPDRIGGVSIGAIRRAAASHTAAVLDLLRMGMLPTSGLVLQEDIPLARLQENRFLSWFFTEEAAFA